MREATEVLVGPKLHGTEGGSLKSHGGWGGGGGTGGGGGGGGRGTGWIKITWDWRGVKITWGGGGGGRCNRSTGWIKKGTLGWEVAVHVLVLTRKH